MIKQNNNTFILEKEDIKNLFNERKINSHKGMYGKCGILGGSINYLGAIKLSNLSLASLRSGVGISRIIIYEDLIKYISNSIDVQTIFPLKRDLDNLLYGISDLKTLCFGMGLGDNESNKILLEKILLNYGGKLLIDADGLNTLSKMDLNILNNSKSKIVLTPHLKEFSRLINKSIDYINNNIIDLIIEFSKRYNVILLLKGHTTYITDGKKIIIVDRGAPGMATAGSGDVLSGIIGGLLSYNDYNIITVSAGAYLAGIAGELATAEKTDIAMISKDTIEKIPNAIKIIRA